MPTIIMKKHKNKLLIWFTIPNKFNSQLWGFLFLIFFWSILFLGQICFAQKLLIPMDLSQVNHLKAYGIVYWALEKEIEWDWLLNYRGGSFMADYNEIIEFKIKPLLQEYWYNDEDRLGEALEIIEGF